MKARLLAALIAIPLALTACADPKETGVKVQANVNLPEPPKLPPLPVAEKYEGGVYSVAGIRRSLLLRRGPKLLDTNQVVRAVVVEHYKGPCPKKAKDCFNKKPHFFVADAMDAKTKLTVIPIWEEEPEKLEKMFEVGKPYDFKGKFTQTAVNGYTDAAGLLNIENPEGEEFPPGLDPTGAPPKRLQ